MSRVDTHEAERRDFHLFIDEFHNFTTDSFAAILAEARKYRLCLTLSHQYLDQLSPEVRQAVFGNAGTMIAFRTGHTDAELLAKEFLSTFIPARFVELDRYQFFIRLLENGVASTPFRAMTLPAAQAHSSVARAIFGRTKAGGTQSPFVCPSRRGEMIITCSPRVSFSW